MSTPKPGPVGAQPADPPWWRLLFLLVQGHDGQWRRGFALVTLIGLLLVGILTALLAFAGWAGGVLGAGWLPILIVAWRGRRQSGRC